MTAMAWNLTPINQSYLPVRNKTTIYTASNHPGLGATNAILGLQERQGR